MSEQAAHRAEEAPFGDDEIFFSRTDERGVILAANEVFQRISGYGWDRLIGAPHRLVRHDDTPKAVFHLMWDRLRNGEPIAAYVKNRAEDGRYYRVLALAAPTADGFLSVRIKPLSDTSRMAEEIYAELHAAEREGWKPDENGHEALLALLNDRGFANYAQFAAKAVMDVIGGES